MFLLGWSKINNVESTDVIAKEIIWNNSQIKCDNKLFFFINNGLKKALNL